MTVVNHGPSDALRVVVTDTLPNARQAFYLSDTGGCTLRDNTLSCNLGDMPAGIRKSFNITVRGVRGEVTNRASVSSAAVDPDVTNNTATRTVTVREDR